MSIHHPKRTRTYLTGDRLHPRPSGRRAAPGWRSLERLPCHLRHPTPFTRARFLHLSPPLAFCSRGFDPGLDGFHASNGCLDAAASAAASGGQQRLAPLLLLLAHLCVRGRQRLLTCTDQMSAATTDAHTEPCARIRPRDTDTDTDTGTLACTVRSASPKKQGFRVLGFRV